MKTEKKIFFAIGIACIILLIILSSMFAILAYFDKSITNDPLIPDSDVTNSEPVSVESAKESAFLPIYKEHIGKNGYISIGSTKSDVRTIMGNPQRISDNTYEYGYSTVFFDEETETVCGYVNVLNELKVYIGEKANDGKVLQLGDGVKETVSVHGTPDRYYGKTWYYGSLRIRFDNDYKVIEIFDEN